MPQNDEQNLIDRLYSGDQSAFYDLVGRHKKKIYYIAYDITGDHHEAEDISQEVFMKVYRSLSTFRRDSKMSSWLYQITVNTSIDSLRRKTAKPAKQMGEFDQVNSQEALLVSRSHANFCLNTCNLTQKLLRLMTDPIISRNEHNRDIILSRNQRVIPDFWKGNAVYREIDNIN